MHEVTLTVRVNAPEGVTPERVREAVEGNLTEIGMYFRAEGAEVIDVTVTSE
jgi:hypothetical protein